MSKCPLCKSENGHEPGCKLVNAKNLADAPPEVQKKVHDVIREAIRNGRISYAPGVKERMDEDGICEDDILGMLLRRTGLDS